MIDGALLRQADFPSGWTAQPHSNSSTEQNNAELRGCLQLPDNSPIFAPAGLGGPHGSSPDFIQGNAAIHNDVSIEPKETIAAAFAVLSRSDLPGCISPVIRRVVQAALDKSSVKASIDSVQVAPLAVSSSGDVSRAYRATTKVSVGGQQTAIYIDLVYVARGAMTSSLTFQSIQVPTSAATESQYTNLTVTRLK